MTPGERVKKVREIIGLTQQEFGERLGFKWFKIKDIEIGKQKLTPEIALEIEKIFSVDFKWLFTGVGEMKPKALSTVNDVSPKYGTAYIPDPLQSRINTLLESMTEDQRRDILKYVEEKKLLADLLAERQGEKAR